MEDKTLIEVKSAIRESARNFSMDEDEDTLRQIAAMTGEQFGFIESDVAENGGDLIPLAEALEVMHFRQHPVWARIESGLRGQIEGLQTKTRKDTLSRDQRGAALDQLNGLEEFSTFVASIFLEAAVRVQAMSSTEKLALGPDNQKIVLSLTGQEVAPDAAPVRLRERRQPVLSDDEIAENTRRATEWIESQSRGNK